MFKDKIVVITGATSGIGQACAEQFAALGARLILIGRREARLQQLAAKIKAQNNSQVFQLKLDIQLASEVQNAINNLPNEWKAIDILINNAGISLGTEAFQTSNPSDWEVVINTNLKGLLSTSRAILPTMIARNTGHIINIGSTAASTYYAKGHVYCATKHAVKAITHCLRIDLAGTPIRVSEIDPGYVKTEFHEVRWSDKGRAKEFYESFTPLNPEDVARTVLFCAMQPSHVNIVEVMLMATEQNAPGMVTRLNANADKHK